jgi:chaperonin cofactor prefoldin
MYDPKGDNYEQYQALLNKVNERQAQLEAQIDDIQQLIIGLQEVRERCTNALAEIATDEAVNS